MRKIETSALVKNAQTRAVAVMVRNSGKVNIYGGTRVRADSEASKLDLLCQAKVERCDQEGTKLKIQLASTRVLQNGNPKWFRMECEDGGLWDGWTGLKKDKPDMEVPVEEFVRGTKIEFDIFEHTFKFVEGEE